MRFRISLFATLALMGSAAAASAEPVDPAQAIAQKFSEASEPKTEPQQTERAMSAAVNRGRPDLDYEMDMLRRARAEELERQQQAKAEKAILVPEQPQPAATPAPLVSTPEAAKEVAPRLAEPAAAPPAPAVEAVVPPATTAATPSPLPTQSAALDNKDDGAAGAVRATVLLVLTRDESAGVADIKPDPIICLDQQCWLSNGLQAPARPMSRSEAVALPSTAKLTDDSCSGKSACAYRNIALAPDAQIQVVEVGESRGVSDGSFTVSADTSCRKDEGDLVCDNALVTQAFRMWVVPEATAQEIGPSGLETAIADGLPDNGDDDAESSSDK